MMASGNRSPAVSAVIPLYNKAPYIRRAVESVLRQSVSDFELIVVDDGSTDGGAEVVEGIHDPRTRLVGQANAGVSTARNHGIAEARADLIAFLDADDEWLPEHLATILTLAEKHPECGAYATAYEVVDVQHRRRIPKYKGIPRPPWEGIIPNYFRSSPVWTSAVAVPKRIFDSVGLFPVGVHCGEDLDMWCRIALKYPVAYSTQVGAVYHREAENRACVMRPPPRFLEHGSVKLLEGLLKSGDLPPRVSPRDLAEYLNSRCISHAITCALSGHRAEARVFLRRAASTRAFRNQRVKWYLLTLVPSALLRAMIRIGGSTAGPTRSHPK